MLSKNSVQLCLSFFAIFLVFTIDAYAIAATTFSYDKFIEGVITMPVHFCKNHFIDSVCIWLAICAVFYMAYHKSLFMLIGTAFITICANIIIYLFY